MTDTSGASTMLPPMPVPAALARQLVKVAKVHRDAEAERDRLIREAVTAGASLREVASLVGLSHAGVARVVARGGVV